jgi:TRAP-type C4-dicarboxylate transport system substrate-binding protein
MSFTELFTALQQKTVDGQENPTAMIYTNKLYEPQKYMTVSEHVFTATGVFISQKVWDKLSPEYQEIVKEAALAAAAQQREQLAALTDEYQQNIVDAGIEVYTLTADEKAEFQKVAQESCWVTATTQYGQDVIDMASKYNQ